jgi:hypothetical protein
VVEPHWSQRHRPDLTPVVESASRQGLLGIAIDEDTARLYKGVGWKSSAMVTWPFMTARFTATNPITIYRLEIDSIFTRGLLFRSTSNADAHSPSTPLGAGSFARLVFAKAWEIDATSLTGAGSSLSAIRENGTGRTESFFQRAAPVKCDALGSFQNKSRNSKLSPFSCKMQLSVIVP